MIHLNESEFTAIREFTHDRWGIALSPEKSYLAEARLRPLVDEYKCSSFSELMSLLEEEHEGALIERFLDVITTHETSFFRDAAFFETLEKEVLPGLFEASESRGRKLRLWSMGCSTGQEAVSLAILVHSLRDPRFEWDVEIRGIDVSRTVVEAASTGVYSEADIERTTRPILDAFIEEEGRFRLLPAIAEQLHFDVANLFEVPIPPGSLDLVLCRNVCFYLCTARRTELQQRISRGLVPGGVLMVGASETVCVDDFEIVQHDRSAYYRRPPIAQ